MLVLTVANPKEKNGGIIINLPEGQIIFKRVSSNGSYRVCLDFPRDLYKIERDTNRPHQIDLIKEKKCE